MPNNIIGERSTTPQNIVGILCNVGSGRGIASIDLDSGCHLVVTYTDGTTWTSDETLRGITSATVTDEYKLKLTYEDGTTWESTQSIRGPVGPSTDTKVGELEDLTTVEKGTAVGAINELDAKGKKAADSAYQLLSQKTTEDTDPYLFRRSAGGLSDRADDTIVGGTVAWNQLIQNGNFESTSNWNTSQSTFSVANNEATIVSSGSGSYPQINQLKNVIVGHKYLMMVKGKSDDTINISFGSSAFVGQHRYQALSTSYTQYAKIYIGDRTVSGASFTISANNGADKSFVVKEANAIDLTQLFGTEIADYIYSLEQETAGAGVAWFKQYFPADYYPYNAGELVSVKPTAKMTRGFNQWDEEWEVGDIVYGVPRPITNSIKSKNFCKCIPNTTYYMYCGSKTATSIYAVRVVFYDAEKNFISNSEWCANYTFDTPSNCVYFKITTQNTGIAASTYGEVYNNDICINLSKTAGSPKNGTYEPYAGRTYPLGAEVRGIISLLDGKLAFNNGDIYTPDGKVKRKYEIIDLGTLNWDYSTRGCFYVRLDNAKERNNHLSNTYANIICNKYPTCTNSQGYNASVDKAISLAYWNGYPYLSVTDTSYGTDAAAFKTAMSGVYLVYELATPTTEQSLPYDSPQVIFPEGTEQYVDDRTVPLVVGHITTYHTDMRNKLESLPDSTLKHWEVGSADQLTTKLGDTDQIPYLYRKSGGDLTVGTREYNTLVGGTVAWNQLVENGNFASNSGWPSEWSYSNNTASFTSSSDGAYNLTLSRSTPTIGGHKYLFTVDFMCTADNRVRVRYPFVGAEKRVTANTWIGYASLGTIQSNGTSVGAQSNQVANETVNYRNMQLFDLTQMLGSTIADYVYSLETATAGSGIAWLKQYGFIDGKYHPYNTGSLVSVHPSEHKMIGFNQFDKATITDNSWINDPAAGTIAANNSYAVSDFVPVFPNTSYYMTACNSSRSTYFDAGKNPIGVTNLSGSGTVFTTPSNAYYVRFTILKDNSGLNTFCINLSKTTGSPKNGDYVPYSANTYTLPDADLRGIFKLDSNNVPYCDGDTDDGSGTRTRKYGIVDLGTLSWSYNNQTNHKYFISQNLISSIKKPADNNTIAKIVTSKYMAVSYNTVYQNTYNNSVGISTSGYVGVVDSAYTDPDVFKTAMSGTYLVYELATPTTETSTAFTNPQVVDPDGTEQYIDERTVSVPVGHSTFYPKDLKRKLEELPDPPSGANGTYILKATINNGVTTYSWVVE